MLSRTRCVCCNALFLALGACLVFPALADEAPMQHHAIVEWYADLSPAAKPSDSTHALTVQTRAAGRVTVAVDFEHHTVTFHVDTKDVSGVRKIELRASHSKGDFAGPTIFTIFDAHDGSFPGSLTKTVTDPDFTRVATPILNSQAAIVVATDANPSGEIAGKITMHKRYEK